MQYAICQELPSGTKSSRAKRCTFDSDLQLLTSTHSLDMSSLRIYTANGHNAIISTNTYVTDLIFCRWTFSRNPFEKEIWNMAKSWKNVTDRLIFFS